MRSLIFRLLALVAACGLSACVALFTSPDVAPIHLASGDVRKPESIRFPATFPLTAADAVTLLNLQSNIWLAQLHSPAVNYMPDTLRATEGVNEFYQVLSVLLPVAAPYATGLVPGQKLIVALLGGFVGYKASKGSVVTQNNECLDLNATITHIQAFDAKWTMRIRLAQMGMVLAASTKNAPAIATIPAPAAASDSAKINYLILTVYSQMVSDEDAITAEVSKIANNCMNPYMGPGPDKSVNLGNDPTADEQSSKTPATGTPAANTNAKPAGVAAPSSASKTKAPAVSTKTAPGVATPAPAAATKKT